MPRPRLNTHALPIDNRRKMQELFGTPAHAYELLCLGEIGLPYTVFMRLWNGQESTERQCVVTEEHFRNWRHQFLVNFAPARFTLSPEKWSTAYERASA